MMDHREHGDFEDEARGGRKRGRRGRCRRLRPAGSKRRDDERNASRDFDAKPKNPTEDEISRRGEPQKRAPRRCAHLSSCTARANLASEVRVTQPRGETPTVYPASFAPRKANDLPLVEAISLLADHRMIYTPGLSHVPSCALFLVYSGFLFLSSLAMQSDARCFPE